MVQDTNFFIEQLTSGLNGRVLGTNQAIDFSGSPYVLLPTGTVPTALTYPALFVAASDASARDLARADYVCDGTADQTEIATALTALGSGAGTVILSKGTFNISSTINVVNPYVQIIGQGWKTVLKLTTNANCYIFTYNPGSSIRMDGNVISQMKLDCNATNQTGTSGGIDGKAACYNVFEHLWIKSPYTYGLSLHDDNLGGFGHHNNVKSCWFSLGTDSPANIGTALYMHSTDENIISGSIFESNGGTASSAAQIFEDSGLQTITNCVFIANPNVASVEHYKHGGGNGTTISNCTFDGGTNAQIELSSYDCVTGCQFFQPISQKYCILCGNASCTITGNVFTSSSNAGASGGAVDASAGTGNIITANTIRTMGSWNGSIISVGTGNSVRNNTGFKTENSGTATVANGATTAVVSHGLAVTPSAANIYLTPTNSMGSATKFYVSTITSTQFTINVNTDPGATTATFSWQVAVL